MAAVGKWGKGTRVAAVAREASVVAVNIENDTTSVTDSDTGSHTENDPAKQR
jgi:hypothetical protein